MKQPSPYWHKVEAAMKARPEGLKLCDIAALLDVDPQKSNSIIRKYLLKGYVVKAGVPLRQRYYLSNEYAMAPVAVEKRKEDERVFIETAEKLAREKDKRNHRKRRVNRQERADQMHQMLLEAGDQGMSSDDLMQKFKLGQTMITELLAMLRTSGRAFSMHDRKASHYTRHFHSKEAMESFRIPPTIRAKAVQSKPLPEVRFSAMRPGQYLDIPSRFTYLNVR